MRTYTLKGAGACPNCGTVLDGVTQVTGRKGDVGPGDLTVCIYCLAELELLPGRSFRRLTPEALAAVDAETAIAYALARGFALAAHRHLKSRKAGQN